MAQPPLVMDLADRLRRDILRGAFAPGDPIKERENAAALGVSRTPMREAIRVLAQEGLVELRPARSPLVTLPDPARVVEQVQVLISLECLGAELACAVADAAVMSQIAQLCAQVEDEGAKGDPVATFEADMAFHAAIVAASGNATLVEMHGGLLRRLWRARFVSASRQSSRERAAEEHGAVVAALQAGDGRAAARNLRAHLGGLITELHEDAQRDLAARKDSA